MDIGEMETLIKNVDARTLRIEQILPTLGTRDDLSNAIVPLATREELTAAIAPLATKDELAAAVAPLATKDELAAAIAPLATRAELREEGERTRRHFDIVAEGLQQSIALIAEGYTMLDKKIDAVRAEIKTDINALDRRVTRLKAKE